MKEKNTEDKDIEEWDKMDAEPVHEVERNGNEVSINLKVEINNLDVHSAEGVRRDIRSLLEDYARENLLRGFVEVTEVNV